MRNTSQNGKPTLELAIARINTVIREVLVLCAKDMSGSRVLSVLNETITYIQTASIALLTIVRVADSTGKRQNQAIVIAMTEQLSYLNLDVVFDPMLQVMLFVVILAWTSMFVMMFLLVGNTMANKRSSHSPWILRTLRSSAKLSTTSLFIPSANTLLRSMKCDGELWREGASVVCGSSIHTGISIISIIVMIPFVVISLLVASVYIDRNPASKGLGARTHGRADIVMLLIKLSLTVTHTYGTMVLPQPVTIGITIAAGAMWMWLYGVMAPFARLTMNSFYVGAGAAFTWFAVCGLTLWLTNGDLDVGLLVIVGGALVGMVGYSMTMVHFNRLVGITSPEELHGRDLWQVLTWARYHVRNAVVTDAEMRATEGGDIEKCPSRRNTLAADRQRESSRAMKGIDVLQTMFPDNGLAHAMASSLLATKGFASRFLVRGAITRARMLSQAFDINFQFYQAIMSMQRTSDSASSGSSAGSGAAARGASLGPVDRLLLEQHKKTAIRAQSTALQIHLTMFKMVASRNMDIGVMTELAYRLDLAMSQAESHFDAMLKIRPDSTEGLRLAAQFHRDISGNAQRASSLTAHADQVEEANMRMRSQKVPHVAFNGRTDDINSIDDSWSGVFTISTDQSRLGEIIAVNSAGLRMLGASTLLHLNINTIIPAPVSEEHDVYLLRFARQGTSSFLDSTRMLLARHTTNGLMPVRFRLFEVPPSADDMRPKLMGIIQTIETDEGFFIIGDESTNYSVLGACVKSARALSALPNVLNLETAIPGPVTAQDIFPQLFLTPTDAAGMAISMMGTPAPGVGDAARRRAPGEADQGPDSWLDGTILSDALHRPVRTTFRRLDLSHLTLGDNAKSSSDSDDDVFSSPRRLASTTPADCPTMTVTIKAYEVPKAHVSSPGGVVICWQGMRDPIVPTRVRRASEVGGLGAASVATRSVSGMGLVQDNDGGSVASGSTRKTTKMRGDVRRVIYSLEGRRGMGIRVLKSIVVATAVFFLLICAAALLNISPWVKTIESFVMVLDQSESIKSRLHATHRQVLALATSDRVNWTDHLTSQAATAWELSATTDALQRAHSELGTSTTALQGHHALQYMLLEQAGVAMTIFGMARNATEAIRSVVERVPGPHALLANMSITEAINAVAMATAALRDNDTKLTMTDPDAQLLLFNSRDALSVAADACANSTYYAVEAQMAAIRDIEVLAVFVAIVFIVVAQCMTASWVVCKMYAEQVNFVTLLYKVPVPIVSALVLRADARIAVFRKSIEAIVGSQANEAEQSDSGDEDNQAALADANSKWTRVLRSIEATFDATWNDSREVTGESEASINGQQQQQQQQQQHKVIGIANDNVRLTDSHHLRAVFISVALVPTLFIALWCIIIITVERQMHQQVIEHTNRLHGLRTVDASLAAHDGALTELAWFSAGMDPARVSAVVGSAEESAARAASYLQATLHGGPLLSPERTTDVFGTLSRSLPPVATGTTLYSTFMEDACPAVTRAAAGTYYATAGVVSAATCASVHSNILTEGLLAAITRLLTLSEDTLRAVTAARASEAATHMAGANISALLAARDAHYVRAQDSAGTFTKLFDPWTRYGLQAMADNERAVMEGQLEAELQTERTATITSFTVTGVILLGLYIMHSRITSRMAMSMRKLLLAVPEEVFMSIPPLRDELARVSGSSLSSAILSSHASSNASSRAFLDSSHSGRVAFAAAVDDTADTATSRSTLTATGQGAERRPLFEVSRGSRGSREAMAPMFMEARSEPCISPRNESRRDTAPITRPVPESAMSIITEDAVAALDYEAKGSPGVGNTSAAATARARMPTAEEETIGMDSDAQVDAAAADLGEANRHRNRGADSIPRGGPLEDEDTPA